MKKKNSVLRKVLAVVLSAVTLLGTGFTTVGQFVGTSGVSVSAAEVYGDFQYSVNDDNTVTVTKYTGNGGDVIIPDTIDGKSVTSIGSWAFAYCDNLSSVKLSNAIISIGDGAFCRCTCLTSIDNLKFFRS